MDCEKCGKPMKMISNGNIGYEICTNRDCIKNKPVQDGIIKSYKSYKDLGTEIGALVDEKNAAYGDSFAKCGEFLKLLYPNGVPIEKYGDMLCQVRIFDKLMRISNKKGSFGENEYSDLTGYGLLGLMKDRKAAEKTNGA